MTILEKGKPTLVPTIAVRLPSGANDFKQWLVSPVLSAANFRRLFS